MFCIVSTAVCLMIALIKTVITVSQKKTELVLFFQ